MHKHRLTTLLLPLSLAVAAHASDNVYTLDDVVVTATRTAQTVDQTLASVSVITREDIEKSQATSVPELLNKLPGVQITSNGGPGASTSVQIRGASSKQSLFLIDGQRIGSATLGTASIQYLDPNQIERIEIVRGPKASLYGADALGGVVNIITRSGLGAPTANLSVGYGSRNTRTASANFSGSSDSTRYHLGISRYITDGYDRTVESKYDNGDDDFYHNTSISLKADHDISRALNIGGSIYKSEGVSEYDITKTNYDPRYIFEEQAISAVAKYSVSDYWLSTLNLSQTKDESEATKTNSLNSYITKRNLVSWQNDVTVTSNTLLTAGLDYYKDKVDSTVNYKEGSRYNKAVFIQTQTSFEDSDLQLAVRRDMNQRYGNTDTGNFAWGINLPENMRVIASYGTAFKAPTFNDLYYPNLGNPNLKPEKSKNKEIELRGSHTTGLWSISAFQNDIEDMIFWVGGYKPTNIDKAKIRGLELEAAAKLQEWDITASVTLLDPKEVRKDTDDQLLARRARQSLSLDIARKFGSVTLGASFLARSSTEEYLYNPVTFKSDIKVKNSGFSTVGLRADWRATSELKIGIKATNLLDKEYQTAYGYNEEPRGIFTTLTWSPEI